MEGWYASTFGRPHMKGCPALHTNAQPSQASNCDVCRALSPAVSLNWHPAGRQRPHAVFHIAGRRQKAPYILFVPAHMKGMPQRWGDEPPAFDLQAKKILTLCMVCGKKA